MVANNLLQPPEVHVPMTLTSAQLGALKEDVALRDLAVGEKLDVETDHHVYQIENCGDGRVLIAGHPEYCPKPVLVDLLGASGKAPLFRIRGICRGSHMEFVHPVYGVVQTSTIKNIRQVGSALEAGEPRATKVS